MKILRLGVSHDARDDIPFDERQHVIAERKLEEATGLEWDTVLKSMWPTAQLPALVERWVEREEPDMVLLFLAGYWASWGSTAVRLERRLPFVGKHAADLARKVATSESAKPHRTLDRLRGVASAAIGVDFNFEPDELVSRFETITRQLLRNGHFLTPGGGRGRPPRRPTKRQTRQSIARYSLFARGIEELCRQLHVEFLPYEHLPEDQKFSDRVPGDPAHYTVEGARRHGIREGELMIRAWQRAETGDRLQGTSSTLPKELRPSM